ncbi:MAG: glycosyltransferase family 39 protein [Thiofilum sp.]|uniref:ArnT family glycosyltransferase n=1 Tax=Thiofilum sp. TaxID=2212733 RepID=UPI0025E2BF2B|nr:glycosyltransferase family 39 protein [Thiofilum sp.]MBK8451893.1 hypothetical protein [Thiofilum sp.]
MVGIPFAFGLAIAPLITGLIAIITLNTLDKNSHSNHLIILFSSLFLLLTIFILISYLNKRNKIKCNNIIEKKELNLGILIFSLVLGCWAIFLVLNSIVIPLTQNDSLEYAMVGRVLFESRSLETYPILDATTTSSGFYAPWTHPPLYVSLIYFSQLLQGNADTPGLMRLLTPWFALCSVYLVYKIGSLSNVLEGIFSALFFISTPLFFLGADSSAIDSLPILAVSILLALLIGVEEDKKLYPISIGFFLGAGLWTHSQFILLIPLIASILLIKNGFVKWKLSIRSLIIIFSISCVVIYPAYAKNYQLFGSFISDNPKVFALPNLDWAGYFEVARGLNSWLAKIQYGILKLWFAMDAYLLVFWFMLLGFYFFIKKTNLRLNHIFINGISSTYENISVSVILVTFYVIGIIISVVLGIDLMIKNERYALIILPAAAVIAGHGTYQLYRKFLLKISVKRTNIKTEFAYFINLLFILFFIVQLTIINWIPRWRIIYTTDEKPTTLQQALNASPLSFKEKQLTNLKKHLNIRAIKWINDNTPKNSIILSLRPADMYYAERKMVSYLDERLVSFYLTEDKISAFNKLTDLNIQYIQKSDYDFPIYYNSQLRNILNDANLTELVYESGGNQIYKLLKNSQNNSSGNMIALTISNEWSKWKQYNGIYKLINRYPYDIKTEYNKIIESKATRYLPIFHRDFSSMVAIGIGTDYIYPDDLSTMISLTDENEVQIYIDFKGKGFIRFWLEQIDSMGNIISETNHQKGRNLIGELVLNSNKTTHSFEHRIKIKKSAQYLRVLIEHIGYSELSVNYFKVIKIY